MTKETAKVISVILLMAMVISICVVGWYGIDTDVREEYFKNYGEQMEDSKDPTVRALADGQMTALELTSMAGDFCNIYSRYTKMDPQRQQAIDRTYEEQYGMTYTMFFVYFLISLVSAALLLLMLTVRLVGRCRESRGAGWELAVLAAATMTYFIVCASEQSNLRACFGGWITFTLALASAIFWKIAQRKQETITCKKERDSDDSKRLSDHWGTEQ